jgi:hypothetical protein
MKTKYAPSRAPKSSGRKWSARVSKTSDALDLKKGAFKGSARQIADAVERASKSSGRRKSSPYRSAVSMISFYENRGGKNLSPGRRRTLQKAKADLKRDFGK